MGRYTVRVRLERVLAKHAAATSQSSAPDPEKIAAQVESALDRAFGSNEKTYTSQARTIIFNLNDPKNVDFRSMLAFGFIRPEEVPHLSPEQMASYEQTVRRARVRKDGREEVQTDWDVKHAPGHVDGVLICDTCWG